MKKHILFIQGGGEGGYEADEALVTSLKAALGREYEVDYPRINSNEIDPDYGWTKEIGNKISESADEMILVGHSFGASMMLKYLSENSTTKNIEGIFLIATPFWSGNEKWKAGLKLKDNFASKLPAKVRIFFYHCKDDEEIPFLHFNQYREKLPGANFIEVENGGHQFKNDLTLIAKDIKSLSEHP